MKKPREKIREELTDTKAGARLPIVGTAPRSFFAFLWNIRKAFFEV